MTKFLKCLFVTSLFSASSIAGESTLTVLHNFTGLFDGGYPLTGLIADKTGALYGSAEIGGDFGACDEGGACGLIFKLTPPSQGGGAWTETELYDFQDQDPYSPDTNLVFDGKGNLYGGAGVDSGNAGSFQLTESNGSWTLNNIYSGGGGTPLIGKSGNLFVIANPIPGLCCSSVVELTYAHGMWNPTTLYTFSGTTAGNEPEAGVVADDEGNLYGTTLYGGTGDCGIVYELSPQANGTWSETTLHNFMGTDGCSLAAGVILDKKGNLYGVTITGGNGPCEIGCGVVFELSPPAEAGGAWAETTLYNFQHTDGSNPLAGLTMSSTGVLYGTTAGGGGGPCEPTGGGCGTIFKLVPPSKTGGGWTESFFPFNGNDGEGPQGSVHIDESSGALYGTTRTGGAYGYGVVWQLLPQ
jgi:uncharacterized repeat protein (TIGR03803 family)